MGIGSRHFPAQGSSPSYRGWAALAGYFDGDGTVEFNIHTFTVEIRLAFDENWKPHLEGIRRFLEGKSIICGKVRKKESFNTWHLVISRISSVRRMARELVKHTVKKRAELIAVLRYLDDEITAEAFVNEMNGFVRKGERTGKIKDPLHLTLTKPARNSHADARTHVSGSPRHRKKIRTNCKQVPTMGR